MRITLATEAFYPAMDGTTRTAKAVVDRLVDLGHLVQVTASGPGLTSYRGCPVVRLGGRRTTTSVRSALAAFDPDVVHVLGQGRVGRTVAAACRSLGLPLAAPPPTRWSPGVDPAAFTPALRDPWLHEHWSRARSRSGNPLVVVGFAGRLEPGHGVRALAALAAVPGIRPVVIGDGPLRGRLQARLPGARFTGELPTGDLAVALATLDVLVHPGSTPGCCNALREAAASGVPLVATDSPAARAVVRHLESGVLAETASGWALARAVAGVAADPRRGLLGECGRAQVTGRDWAVAVDELLAQHYPAARPGVPGLSAA